ncbi:phosphoserine phosphatase serb [Microthyrium microscopicum]|uniref:phosphoserine phosphatase n=1 Tax=Microthyrium microscopicum TaxID=703497 RepID=A0A6A6U312_9PEZI|nr:phosphoserine phosphatase serb [Microthyrium microscopicum]
MAIVSVPPTIVSEQATSFIATIFARALPGLTDTCIADFISRLQSSIPDATATYRLLDASATAPTVAELKFTTSHPIPLKEVRNLAFIAAFEEVYHAQVAIQLDNVHRRHKRLAVFDMDSTLIQQEVIDEIARKIGVEDQVSEITERAMNGELDFAASLRARCALLQGVSSSVFEELKQVITLSPGAGQLVKAFKRLGYKTAVLSGGFLPLTSWQAQQLGLDYAHANHLVVSDDGKTLTGQLTGAIVDAQKKAELVREIAKENGIALDQVIAIGDGANDLPMMWTAGLGVAFNAKARVQQQAPVKLNSGSLVDVLFLLGLNKSDQDQLLSEEI